MFFFYCLISWKISPNLNQIRNCGSWIRSASSEIPSLFVLYKHVLDKPVGDGHRPLEGAKKRRRPPAVMTKAEVRQVLNQMKGTHLLMAKSDVWGRPAPYGVVLAAESQRPRFCEIPSACQRQGWKGPPHSSAAIHLRRPEGTPFMCQKDIQAVSSPLETP